jgi:hypothetical protein
VAPEPVRRGPERRNRLHTMKHSSLKPLTFVRAHFRRLEDSILPTGVQVVCGYWVPESNSTADPREVTCVKCNKWLSGHVQYHNYALAKVRNG